MLLVALSLFSRQVHRGMRDGLLTRQGLSAVTTCAYGLVHDYFV